MKTKIVLNRHCWQYSPTAKQNRFLNTCAYRGGLRNK